MKHGTLSIWDKAYLTLVFLCALLLFSLSVEPLQYLLENGSEYKNDGVSLYIAAYGHINADRDHSADSK